MNKDIKEYDLIIIGTGSAMNLVEPFLNQNHHKVAVIDKDEPGGICLTRGCIPSKILLYPADLVRLTEKANELHIKTKIEHVDFPSIMERMRRLINSDIENIRQGLSHAENIDYYPHIAKFVAPYTLAVNGQLIKSDMIFLCTGSKPYIPPIENIDKVEYHTSRTILDLTELPESLVIVGGGYIAGEYGHFFSAMGSKVTIIGRNPQFLPDEEPEISAVAQEKLSKYLKILTNHEVVEIKEENGQKVIIANNRVTNEKTSINSSAVLIATGRASNSDVLEPEKSGIEIDQKGWIKVNEYLETSKSNIWAMGDANGQHLLKHVGNYESQIVYYNAIAKKKVPVDYHAVPHAVFSYPEVASVGMKEREAIEKHGKDNILIGFQKYEHTAKGEAMHVKNYFVKIILKAKNREILGAHIVGPQASVLIQEIINLMYTEKRTMAPIQRGMHIHPALSEVVQRAFFSLMRVENYQHMLEHDQGHH